MTADNDKMEAFCDAITSLIIRKKWRSTPPAWRALRRLARAFWKGAPEVSDDWKRAARRYGYEPGELHEILLGVFLSGNVNSAEQFRVLSTGEFLIGRTTTGAEIQTP